MRGVSPAATCAPRSAGVQSTTVPAGGALRGARGSESWDVVATLFGGACRRSRTTRARASRASSVRHVTSARPMTVRVTTATEQSQRRRRPARRLNSARHLRYRSRCSRSPVAGPFPSLMGHPLLSTRQPLRLFADTRIVESTTDGRRLDRSARAAASDISFSMPSLEATSRCEHIARHERRPPLALGDVAQRESELLPPDAHDDQVEAGPGVELAVQELQLGPEAIPLFRPLRLDGEQCGNDAGRRGQ